MPKTSDGKVEYVGISKRGGDCLAGNIAWEIFKVSGRKREQAEELY